MAWADAKARIAVDLAAVAITSPITQTIKKVYTDPPGTIGDTPCFIIYPPALTVSRTSSSLRTKVYTVRLRLLVSDADLSRASALVDAYREAVVDAFDAEVALNFTATIIEGPNIEEAASFTYGAKAYTGMDCMLTVRLLEAANFQP